MDRNAQNRLVLPGILFGSERQVQKEWRKVVRRAWKTKQWSHALVDVEMVAAKYVDALVVSSSPLLRTANPDCWRIYVVGEAFKDVAFKAMSPGAKGKDEFDFLLLDGMRQLWFVIGLFQSGGGSFNWSDFPRSRPTADVLCDYMDRFAYWLPELVELEGLFYDDLKLLAVAEDNYHCPWALSIVGLAGDCDVELPMEANWSGETLVNSLLDEGLIEPFNGRYRTRRSHAYFGG